MKARWLTLIVGAMACAILLGCAATNGSMDAPDASSAATAMESGTVEMEQAAGLANPVHEVASYAALLAAQPQNMLADAPEGASDISYSYIDGDPVISQIKFVLGENEYTYRAAAVVSEAAQNDISGVYDELNKIAALTAESNTTFGGAYTLRYSAGTTKGLASWYYAPTSCQYTLWTPTGCDVAQQIEEVVDSLLPIQTDAYGNPLTIPANTPLPAVEAGTVKGTIVDIQTNVITLHLANNNTLQFLLSNLKDPGAQVGDEVEVTYSGNLLDTPEATKITVLSSGTKVKAVTGTVMQHTEQSVFVQISSVNIFGFIIDRNTAFKGLSNVLKTGNKVNVSYSGDLSNAPLATVIETIEVSADPEPAPEKDPVDKTLIGTVTDLTSKRVTLYSDSGHTYSFQRDGSTLVTGNYALEYGSRIRVLYDGYASNAPLARRIDVLAPPDPTPPDPTPYVPTTYTINGTIAMTAGNALVVDADNGAQYSFLLRAPSISGDIIEGFRITVTYQVEADGSLNATRISTSPPVVYGPGPVLMDVEPEDDQAN